MLYLCESGSQSCIGSDFGMKRPAAAVPSELCLESPDAGGTDKPIVPRSEGQDDFDIGQLTPSEEKEVLRVLRVYKFCCRCSGGSIRPEGWAHRTRTKHEMRALTDEEKDKLRSETIQKLRGGPAVAKQLFEDKRRDEQATFQSATQDAEATARQEAEDTYRFECGQFRRKTIPEYLEVCRRQPKHKDYLAWCVCNRLHTSGRLPGLQAALVSLGLWESTCERSVELKKEMRTRDVQKKKELDLALDNGGTVHKDIVKMRSLKAKIALRDAEAEDEGIPAWAAAVPAGVVAPQASQRPSHKSRAVVMLQHCKYCGDPNHKMRKCPKAQRDAMDGAIVRPTGVVDKLQKQLWRVTAHLKYTWVHDRTDAYNDKKEKRCRAPVVRSGDELARMTVRDFCHFLFEDGLLVDLQGQPCTNPKCASNPGKFSADMPSALGPWRVKKNIADMVQSVRLRDACYRCKRCRCRYPLSIGHPLHSLGDTLDEPVRAYWNFLEDASVTYTCRQMNRDEGLIRRYYKTARAICEWDALRRQSALTFGKRGPLTTTVEADCSRFGKFEGVEDGRQVYYSWVIIGVMRRGDPASLWLREYPRITKSFDRARVAPEEKEVWLAVADELFDHTSNIVLMTDSAAAFFAPHPGIKQHFAVNHSEKEWTRPEPAVLVNADTGATAPGMAGTPLLDSTWGRLKDGVPKGLAADTPERRAIKMSCVRAAQWKLMIQPEDRWVAFCKAAKDWNAAKASDFQTAMKRLHPKLRPARVARSSKIPANEPLANQNGQCSNASDGEGGISAKKPRLSVAPPPVPATETSPTFAASQQSAAGAQGQNHRTTSDEDCPSCGAILCGGGGCINPDCQGTRMDCALLFGLLCNTLGLPGDVVCGILAALQINVGASKLLDLAREQWFLDLENWRNLSEEILSKADRSFDTTVVFDLACETVFNVTRIVIQQDDETIDVSGSDQATVKQMQRSGWVVGTGAHWSQNDCLSDSLLQHLIRLNILKSGVDRRAVCSRVREHLNGTVGLAPRDSSGRISPAAYLQHHRHADAILTYLLRTCPLAGATWPEQGFRIVINTRVAHMDDSIDVCRGSGTESGAPMELRMWNWTGRGFSGYHYDPVWPLRSNSAA